MNYNLKAGLSLFLVFAVFLWCFSPHNTMAQGLSFRNYSVKEGMSQSQIKDIVQDKEGYLWFATAEGLTRFDGRKFRHYSKKDGLANTFINKILIDSRGDFWLGHRAMGITKYSMSERKFQKISLPEGFQNAKIQNIYEKKAGVLWFLTERRGLLKYENDHWTIYGKADGLPEVDFYSFCSNQNRFWIGSKKGIVVFNPEGDSGSVFYYLKGGNGVPTDEISALLEDSMGTIWIGTSKSGIIKYMPPKGSEESGTFTNISSKHELLVKNILCISEDTDQNIWFGSSDHGIIRYTPPKSIKDTEEIFVIDSNNGLKIEKITTIFQDREGSFWFGTDGGGVNQFRGNRFEQYGKREGLLDEMVWAIYQDRNGSFWFGSEKGLTHSQIKEGKLTHRYYTSVDWEGNNSVTGIHEDYRGHLWLCVLGTGVREFNPKNRIFRKIHGLEQKKIICIEEDSEGDLWFGSFNNGVFRINIKTGELHNYKMGDGFGSNTVFKILNTKKNELWFATNGGGIAKFNGTTFVHYGKEQGFPAPSVLSLIDDYKGNLWIGTEGDGLFKYDGDTFQNYSKKFGIWQDDIYSLICDDENNVWIGTRRGIEKFNPTTGEIKKYGEFEGFSAIETNQNAVCKDSENRIWFGTIEGAIRFNPQDERINPIPPLTYINDIRLYMQEFSIPEDNTYSYTDNFLTFSFTGLSFVVPEKVRYSYKLKGLDRDWSPLTDERYATYANIPPGDYVFKVKSKNNDNVWSEEAAVYNFSIAAPFWQKRWFFMAVILVLAIVVYGTHRYRVRSIYQNNLRLEKMIHARTKDLVMQKEKAQKSYDALLETENKLKQVTGSIDAYLWSLSFDESGNLKNTFLTDTFFKVVGYQRDEFPAGESALERFYKIIHPEDRNFVEISLKSMRDGNNVEYYNNFSKESTNLGMGFIMWVFLLGRMNFCKGHTGSNITKSQAFDHRITLFSFS